MAIKHSVFLPTGFGQEFAGIPDPVEAYETMTRIAQVADEVGFDTLWLADHFLTIPPSQEKVFESWTSIAALLRDTTRIRVGHLVAANNYRNPALQAKMASTLDVLGHGRFSFGIGSGWFEAEYNAFGFEYLGNGDRLRQLGEAVQIILSMWTEDETTFEGKYYQVRGAINQPKGVQQPHIPLLIAGAGEKVTLKLVAQYGDACNVIESPAGLERKYAVLKGHCDEIGRDYDSIRRTTTSICIMADTDKEAQALVPPGTEFIYPGGVGGYGLIGSPETIRQRIADYEGAGVQEIATSFINPTNLDDFRQFAAEYIK
jgi:F420-dependent oxidoreductase-like protein